MRLLTALFFLAAASQETVAPTVAPKDTWNQFRGSPMRTGRSAAEIPDALTLLWSFEAGFSIDSSAAIVDDVVYMTALPGLVAALALDDGTVRWKRDFGEEEDRFGESSPMVVDGTVYVGDLLGVVHAFELSGQAYSLTELKRMLAAAGLTLTAACGDWKGTPVRRDSRLYMFLASKDS